MSERGERAQALFEQGYNCSQAVVGAFADELGMDPETAIRLASPFGGGMGRMREVCGAVSGMLMVAGLRHGYTDPKAREEKKETYAMVQELADRMKRANGSIICRELLGLAKPEGSPDPTPRTAEFYRKRPCGEIVRQAVEILEEYEREQQTQKS